MQILLFCGSSLIYIATSFIFFSLRNLYTNCILVLLRLIQLSFGIILIFGPVCIFKYYIFVVNTIKLLITNNRLRMMSIVWELGNMSWYFFRFSISYGQFDGRWVRNIRRRMLLLLYVICLKKLLLLIFIYMILLLLN